MSATRRRGPWSVEEDKILLDLLNKHGVFNWVKISSLLKTRSPKQCRERYHQNLKPSLNKTPISEEEGELIQELVSKIGKKWAEISRVLNNGRSDNAIKNWWNGGSNKRKRVAKNGSPRPTLRTRHRLSTIVPPVPVTPMMRRQTLPSLHNLAQVSALTSARASMDAGSYEPRKESVRQFVWYSAPELPPLRNASDAVPRLPTLLPPQYVQPPPRTPQVAPSLARVDNSPDRTIMKSADGASPRESLYDDNERSALCKLDHLLNKDAGSSHKAPYAAISHISNVATISAIRHKGNRAISG
ncbi:HBR368Wp [Eremothecium sinecaudum]|uniref:HBR368Wp n=1 Tax=Eremothecium sinecaudum TaxID=45286 RepID=A0A109UXE8_9SACH|nr:HBR368Wp [Eremothecium sinecaudum]AMD19269.1 HBR368Wp [Eremothecium sinecaudum]